MQRSKSFTSIAFEQKQKAAARKASPTRQSRPKPEWNDYLTDPNRFKIAEEDVLKKKKMLVSKNNILVAEYRPTRVTSTSVSLATSTPRSTDSSYSTPRKPSSVSSSVHFVAKSENKKNSEHMDSLYLLSTHSSDAESSDSSEEADDDDNEEEQSSNEQEENGSAKISSTHLNGDEEELSKRKTYVLSSPHRKVANRSLKSKSTKQKPSIAPSVERPRTTWGTTQRSSLVVPSPVVSNHHDKAPASNTKEPSTTATTVTQPTTPLYPQKRMMPFVEKDDDIPDEDLLDIARNIDNLQQELRMYEELAGKKSILDADELNLILNTDEIGRVDVHSLNQKSVIRSLVSLVCQTMTYTLQSEVKQQHLESEMNSMQSKLDEVLRMVQQQQQTNAAYSRYVLTALPPSVASLPSPVANMTTIPPTLSSIDQVPVVAASPALSRTDAVADHSSSTAQFYGTSTSDWLFMRPPQAASTKLASPSVVPAPAVTEEAHRTPVANYEYQLSPETAADLATRTYDMYLQQQKAREQAGRDEHDTHDASFETLDHYEDMINRLTNQFSTNKVFPASTEKSKLTYPAESASMVVPNKDVPTPAKASPHPLSKSLFPASPATAKKIYDASLGNYSLIDAYDM